MLTVPVLRPEVEREYEEYQAAVDEYNRRRMEEMRQPAPGAPVCMAYAHAAPRCAHVRADGTRCAAPALRERSICYAHTRMLMARKPGLKLPVLEDAGGIALAAMQVVQQMLDGKLPRRKAATALYGIQIVASALNHRPFAVQPTSVVMEAEGLPPEEELLESAGSEAAGPLKEGRQDQGTKQSEAQVANAIDPGDGAARAEQLQEREPEERCEELRLEMPLNDSDPSLRSGFQEKRSGPEERGLGPNNTVQSPLGKEWWDAWEAKVTAIARGEETGKGSQGVRLGDLREGGVG